MVYAHGMGRFEGWARVGRLARRMRWGGESGGEVWGGVQAVV